MEARRSSLFWSLAALFATTAFVTACGHAPPPRSSGDATGANAAPVAPVASASTAAPHCDVLCGRATVISLAASPEDSADYYTNEAAEHANATLDAMHDDLLACYAARVKTYPKAHAFLTLDIVVAPDGSVQAVETQGGALLGAPTMKCIVDRVKRGAFAPPPRGGTMRLQVPVTLRRVGADETI